MEYTKLMEKGQYKEALKLLLEHENLYLEKITCLYEMKEYDKVISFFESIVDKLEQDYFEVLGFYILSLLEENQFDKALDVLNEELSMPYVQDNYQVLLDSLYDNVIERKKFFLAEQESTNILSVDEIKHLLLDHGDFVSQFKAISALDQINVRSILDELEVYLTNPRNSSILKSFILERLTQQQVSQGVLVNKNNCEYEVMPLAFNPVFQDHNFILTRNLLEEHLDSNPSLLAMAYDILDSIVYILYPETIEEDEQNLYAAAIEYYVYSLNYEDLSVDFESYYDLDLSSVEKFSEYLSSLLENEKELSSDVTY